MAVNSKTYHTNAVPGTVSVAGEFNVFETHSTPKFAVGTRFVRSDGNEFVYSHFGADTNRGLLVAPDISESGNATVQDNICVAPASAVTTSDGTIGSKFIEITLASVTANMFAGGYLITADATGEGYTYRIKGNTATDNPATGNFRLELHDELQVAIDATTDIMIVPCKYANLEAATTGTDNFVVGVSCANMTTASTAYGWICVKGVVGLLVDGTIAIGEMVTLSDSEAGQVQAAAGGSTAVADLIDERVLGQCIVAAGASTEHAAFFVSIS